MTPTQIEEIYKKINSFIESLITELQDIPNLVISYDPKDLYNQEPLAKVILYWIKILKEVSVDQNTADVRTYHKIYSDIGILPPDRYGSLVIQVTTGCIYNKCAFCTLYENIKYSYKVPEVLSSHIKDISEFMDESLGRFHSIFIGDANALTIPFEDLLEIFKLINKTFTITPSKVNFIQKNRPSFEGIYSFLDVFTGFKLTTSHFKDLASLNLRMVYLGIETGSTEVLNTLNKPNTTEKILKIINSLHESSIGVAVIFLIGAGGKTLEQSHIQESIALIKQMNLNSNDIIYLSKLFIYKRYQEILSEKKIKSLTEDELESQLITFKELLYRHYESEKSKPIVTRYELLDFIY